MAFSLFTFNIDVKPLVAAVKDLTATGTRIADALDRQFPKPLDRSKVKPAGPEAYTVMTEPDRILAQHRRQQDSLLGRQSERDE